VTYTSLDEYRKGRKQRKFDEIINKFASIKARNVLFLLACYRIEQENAEYIDVLMKLCLSNTIHLLHYITYCTIQIKRVSF